MPARLPIPRFTLYTGGKECSLCEVAKHELSILRRTTPFELTLWNIRDPPENADVKEAKKWRRLYQYDIPVLHLGEKRIQKHRIDRTKLQTFIEEWQASHSQQQTSESSCNKSTIMTETETKTQSVLRFSSASSRVISERDKHGESASVGFEVIEESGVSAQAEGRIRGPRPWKTYLGKAFFRLPSPVGEYTPESEGDIFAPLLEKTFKGFSDIPIGSDIPIIDLSQSASTANTGVEVDDADGVRELSWEIDTRPGITGIGEEGGDVLYDEPTRESTGWQTNQVCWNCLETGHAFSSCPHPRNYAQVRKSRDDFIYARDHLMPEQAIPALQLYLDLRVTQDEKDRRLELVDRFVPGKISAQLEDAICFVVEENDMALDHYGADMGDPIAQEEVQLMKIEREKIEMKRRRKRWDWYEGMMRWGYPIGWVAGRDPIEEVKRRITLLKVHEKPFDTSLEMNDGDDLQIFGGTLGTPTFSPDGEPSDDSIIGSNTGMNSDTNASSSAIRIGSEKHGDQSDDGMEMDMDLDYADKSDTGAEPASSIQCSNGGGLDSPQASDHLGVATPSNELPSTVVDDGEDAFPPPENIYPPSPSSDAFDPLAPPPAHPPPPPDDLPPPPPPPDDCPPPPPSDPPPPTPLSLPYTDGQTVHGPRSSALQFPTAHAPQSRPQLNNITKHPHTPHVYTSKDTPDDQRFPQTPHSAHASEKLAANPSTLLRPVPIGPKGYRPPTPTSKSIPTGPRGYQPPTPMKRWAKYHTDLFDSERLMVYDESRPFPLGSW
ncbi:hypothetical protein I316_01338 [Kwoniella heveanensis BCC8398]|uniref:CCHC-type domain-containing protein n=1 Tax=Kwoniella heveanensis BCC8398 TaxID=1296120 RepID=A0A1B9H0D9_9TREE|nr:hypothetical protein I316_01338 [Kwoniella heveanensis BCC8398]